MQTGQKFHPILFYAKSNTMFEYYSVRSDKRKTLYIHNHYDIGVKAQTTGTLLPN